MREHGFSLHAATRAGAADPKGREALLKYILRPPVATERVVAGPDGLVRVVLKKPFNDGTVAIDLDPLSLLCRLAATVPPPRFHTVRYAGVLSSHAKWRRLVVPGPPPDAPGHDPNQDRATHTDAPRETRTSRYRPWAELLRSTFGIDVETCPRCGCRMRLLALVTESNNVARFLRHLGEPTEPPRRAPARDPPTGRAASCDDDTTSSPQRPDSWDCSRNIERRQRGADSLNHGFGRTSAQVPRPHGTPGHATSSSRFTAHPQPTPSPFAKLPAPSNALRANTRRDSGTQESPLTDRC